MLAFHSDTAGWWLVGLGSLPLIGSLIAVFLQPSGKQASTSKGFNWDRVIGLLLIACGAWRLLRH